MKAGVITVTGNRSEALARLDVFVGEWVVQARFPGQPAPPGAAGDGPVARSWFEWALDGQSPTAGPADVTALWTATGSSRSTALTCAWTLLATRLTPRSCSSAAWAARWTGGRRSSVSGWRRADALGKGGRVAGGLTGGPARTRGLTGRLIPGFPYALTRR